MPDDVGVWIDGECIGTVPTTGRFVVSFRGRECRLLSVAYTAQGEDITSRIYADCDLTVRRLLADLDAIRCLYGLANG